MAKPIIRLAVSACLLGIRVRYDGGHKHNPLLSAPRIEGVRWLPFCPEAGCGLGVPREPMRLQGNLQEPRLCTAPDPQTSAQKDHTHCLHQWCHHAIEQLCVEKVDGFLFKSRSPSCGLKGVDVFTDLGVQPHGVGVFARLLRSAFPHLPMAEGDLMQDKKSLQTFFNTFHPVSPKGDC